MICYVPEGDPGNLVVWFQSCPKGLRTMGANAISPNLRSKAREPGALMSKEGDVQLEQKVNTLFLCILMYSGALWIG